ncbi:MAG: hypothetical protein MUE53_07040 [Chitinophagales bacterium]|jgi:hypothetical protein|nr:hypothetical protein [Chitinophagales bacterium]
MKKIRKAVWFLFHRTFSEKTGLLSISLYGIGIIYVTYVLMSFPNGIEVQKNASLWVALLIMILLFTILQQILFQRLTFEEMLYIKTLFSAKEFIWASFTFYMLISWLYAFILLVFYSLWFGIPLFHKLSFILTYLLSIGAFSVLFSFVSLLVTQARNAVVLSTIIGFPLSLPLSTWSAQLFHRLLFYDLSFVYFLDLLVLLVFSIIIINLALILIPYIWVEE